MDHYTLVGVAVAVVVVVAGILYKKVVKDRRSNMPSPGFFWLRSKGQRSIYDLLDFVKKNNNPGLVQVFAGWQGYSSWAFITHPETAQTILKDDDVFEKELDTASNLHTLIENSLFNANGEKYRNIKNIISPAFHYEQLASMSPVFGDKAQILVDKWLKAGQDISVREDLSHFTLDTLGLYAFGINFDCLRGKSHEYLKFYNALLSRQRKSQADVHAAVNGITQMVFRVVATKKENKEKQQNNKTPDFLDRLIAAQNSISELELRDNVFLMFLAGHETTATALTWAVYYLALHQDIQQKLRDEVDSVLKGATPGVDEVRSLNYLDMFIKEVLRIKPPVGIILSRRATRDSNVGKYFVPKNTHIGLSMHTIHHLEEFWPNPENFDPLRFTPENSAGRHPFAYLPFSLGKRSCLGNNFSLLEQKILLAVLVQRATLTLSAKCDAKELKAIHMTIPTNISITVTPRKP